LDGKVLSSRLDLPLLSDPLSRQPGPAGNDAAAHAVTVLAGMVQGAGDADLAACGRRPAANGGIVGIVAGVSAAGIQQHPAKFRIGPLGSSLPGSPLPVRQGREADLRRRLVVTAVTELPQWRRRGRNLGQTGERLVARRR